MGKSTISMVIFNSYFDITRGYMLHVATSNVAGSSHWWNAWLLVNLQEPLAPGSTPQPGLGARNWALVLGSLGDLPIIFRNSSLWHITILNRSNIELNGPCSIAMWVYQRKKLIFFFCFTTDGGWTMMNPRNSWEKIGCGRRKIRRKITGLFLSSLKMLLQI